MPLYLLYVFLAPFEYIHEKFPTGPAGLNYLNVTLALAVLGWLGARLVSGPPFLTPSPLNPILGIYLALTYAGLVHTCLSIPEATCPFMPDSPALHSYLRLANGIIFFWLATTFVSSRQRARRLFLVLAAAVAFAFRAFYVELSSVRRWHYQNDMRVNGPFVYLGSNEIAAYFAFLGVFLAIVAPAMERVWQRAVLWVASALCGYAVLYSYSRGAWLAVVVAVAILTVFRYRWLFMVLIVVAVATPLWLPASVRDRFDMTTDEAGELESSAASRKELAQFALAGVPGSPLFGHGGGSFVLLNPKQMDTHNLYLRTLYEGGIVGLVVLLSIWLGILHIAIVLWRRSQNPLDQRIGVGLFVATAGLMAANVFGDRFTYQALIAQVWSVAGVGARLVADAAGREPLRPDPAVNRNSGRRRTKRLSTNGLGVPGSSSTH